MKKFVCVLVFALLLIRSDFGAAQTAVGYDFLNTFVGARPAAMGGAFVGIVGDVHNIAYNPAGLSHIGEKRGTFSYLNHLLDFNSGFLAYAQPFSGGTAAASLNFIDFGQFERRGEKNEDTGEFGSNGLAFSLSYARFLIKNFAVGGNVKYIRFQIDTYTASAIAMDAGLSYTIPGQDLSIGLAVQNFGSTTSAFIQTKDDLPLTVQLGASKTLAHLPVFVSGALVKTKDEDLDFRLGGEIRLREQLRLRLGYNSVGLDQKTDTSMDRLAGVSMGIGFVVRKFDIDYSFSSFGEVGSLNRFTLVSRF